MNNKAVTREFKLLAKLLEFHGENSFKVKAISNAASTIAKLPFAVASKSTQELSEIPGIGKSTANKITEILEKGHMSELNDLIQQTPPGIVPLLKIKGISPKKMSVIWKDLGIDNEAELWYACKEDKISKLKGFGAKTQAELQNVLEYAMENQGKFRFADAEKTADKLLAELRDQLDSDTKFGLTGDMRRLKELVSSIDILVALPADTLYAVLQNIDELEGVEPKNQYISCQHRSGIDVIFHYCEPTSFSARLIETTGSQSHVNLLKDQLPETTVPALESEEAIYKRAKMIFIAPEMREGNSEIELALTDALPDLVKFSDIKGALHNHSLWSDGVFSIEEMALFCRDQLNLEYFGISDHSKTAVYAKGLTIDQVKEQWKEIEALNKKLAPFRIFKGIESDILSNGSLDYPDEILAGFDFVVASIHSQLSMDEKKATARLIKAIENPYTTFLGHPTGRQLLVRRGYPIDHKKVIDACAANQVIIEINANPLRLDIDWRWLSYCLEKGVILSINPDAHHTEELEYMKYGIHMARKGGLQAEHCFNCLDTKAVADYFAARKANINP